MGSLKFDYSRLDNSLKDAVPFDRQKFEEEKNNYYKAFIDEINKAGGKIVVITIVAGNNPVWDLGGLQKELKDKIGNAGLSLSSF